MSLECEHGQLARACNICEYEREIAELNARVGELEAERDAAVKWLDEYKSKTYCAYCGATFNIDSDASHVSEHIRTCPHHPMRALEAENKRLREERDRYLEELVVAKNVIKSDESQIKNLIKRNDEMRDDCIRTAEQRDKLADENAKLRELLHKCLMGGVFFSSALVAEVKQALGEASHET
jgi:DNA repair exonuclease SbcCD ATPase subunit